MQNPATTRRPHIRSLSIAAFLCFCVLPYGSRNAVAESRTWSSANGAYTLQAEVIAFNKNMVVLKKEDGNLVAVDLSELSDEDRKYVESKEAADEKRSAEKMQTWTSIDGLKIQGRVIAYGKKKLPIQRKRGKVYVDEQEFSKLEPLRQKVILKVMSKIEKREIADEKQLTEWAKSLRAEAKVYPLEGVLLELESGDQIGVPFFMFRKEDLAVLEPGWRLWLEQHESEKLREQGSLMVRAQAQAYQADRKSQRQIEMLKLELLATATGVTSVWQVGLIPARGNFGRALAVMVTARDSQTASFQALQRYPGYSIGGVRKVSR